MSDLPEARGPLDVPDGNEGIDPDRFEHVDLPTAFRGLDPDAVHALLAEAAGALRAAQGREEELRSTIRELEAALADARPATEAELEAAKARGRELVLEAQAVRHRILEDLARRRRALRRQIEQLRAGRERLLETYEVIDHTVREATQELAVTLNEAQAAAERAGRRVAGEAAPPPADEVAALEAEIDAARLAGLPIVAPPTEDERRVVAADEEVAEGGERVEPEPEEAPELTAVEPVVAAFEEVRVLEPVADAGTEEPEEREPEVAPEPEAAAAGEVLRLFDRIRADAEVPDEPDAPEEPVAEEPPLPDREPVSLVLDLAAGEEPGGAAEAEVDPVAALADDLARRIRSELADEQNQVLDRLRQERKGPVEVDRVLGEGDALVVRLATAVEGRLQQAQHEGVEPAEVPELAHRLAGEVAAGVRAEVGGRVTDADEPDVMARAVREAFRAWRTDRIAPLALEVAAAALGRG